MPAVPRADVDSAVYNYFEQVGLDLEATREALSDARERKLQEVPCLSRRSARPSAPASAWSGCTATADGRLDADDWRSFRDELGAEREAAEAEARRLRDQEREVEE